MPTVPDNPVAGVLYSTASIQKLATSTVELQGAGVLVTAGNAATNANTVGSGTPTNIVSWNTAPITLAASRKIQMVIVGQVNASAIGNQAIVNLTLGSITHVISRWMGAVGAGGQVDINSTSPPATFAAGSYSLAATLVRGGVAGTVTMAGNCYLYIMDLGPA